MCGELDRFQGMNVCSCWFSLKDNKAPAPGFPAGEEASPARVLVSQSFQGLSNLLHSLGWACSIFSWREQSLNPLALFALKLNPNLCQYLVTRQTERGGGERNGEGVGSRTYFFLRPSSSVSRISDWLEIRCGRSRRSEA